MPKQLFLLDTNNATIKTTTTLTGPNYFNISYPIRIPIQNLRKITLKSAEIPLLLHQQRDENSSTQFNFRFSNATYSNIYVRCALVPKSDRTQAQLISDINATINASLSNHQVTNFIAAGVSISLSVVTNLFTINLSYVGLINNCTSITLDDTTLISRILGFSTPQSRIITPALGNASICPIQLNIDNLIYMRITNLPISNNNLLLPYTFKIPIPSSWTNSQTVFYSDNNDLQSIDYYSSSSFIDKLDITIVDRYGLAIPGYFNWTCTLLLEFGENNNNEPQFLNINN